jgi:hypothetical protein
MILAMNSSMQIDGKIGPKDYSHLACVCIEKAYFGEDHCRMLRQTQKYYEIS